MIKKNIGGLLHMTNVLIRFSFIFKTICTTPAVHLFINLWMPHHKSTYWQHKVLHSNASSKKKEKEIYLENDIREKKKRKVLLLTVQQCKARRQTKSQHSAADICLAHRG